MFDIIMIMSNYALQSNQWLCIVVSKPILVSLVQLKKEQKNSLMRFLFLLLNYIVIYSSSAVAAAEIERKRAENDFCPSQLASLQLDYRSMVWMIRILPPD